MNANRFLYLLAATFVFCDTQVSVSVAQTNYGQGCNPGYIKVNGQCVSASSGAGKMAAIDAQRGSPPTQPMPTSNPSGAAQCGYPNTWNGSACIPPKPTQPAPTSNPSGAARNPTVLCQGPAGPVRC